MSPRELEFKPPYVLAAEALRDNPEQWAAYESEGNCVILAGPGSGKTKTLTIKMARILAEDVRPPRGIACITYNNACARELKNRLAKLGIEEGHRAFIGTVHSFCLRHIVLPFAQIADLPKQYPITIASFSDIKSLQEEAVDRTAGTAQKWKPSFDKYRRTHLDRNDPSWLVDDPEAAAVIDNYEELLDAEGLIDFDGMILIGLYLVENFPWVRKALHARFPVLVVDEYQDLGYALDRIVRCLCFEAGARLVAVGDPDQSIYGFTGAEPTLLRELAEQPSVAEIRLRLNYRCGDNIIQASQVTLGEQREFQAVGEEPGAVFFHERTDGVTDQVDYICSDIIPQALERRLGRKIGDIAVLYKNKNDGDSIATCVQRTGWQFVRVDANNPYERSPVTFWLEDCAAWCAGDWRTGDTRLSDVIKKFLTFNETDASDSERRNLQVALVRFLHSHREPDMPLYIWLQQILDECLGAMLDREPRLRDDKEKVEKLLRVSAPGGELDGSTVAFFAGQKGSPDHLTLTTLHSAKGLEYDVVIIFGLEEGRIPYFNSSAEDIREERRLFYVGMTRARHEIHLVYSGWYQIPSGRIFEDGPSRFVCEVQDALAL